MQRLRFGVRSWVIGLFTIAGLVLIGQGPSQAGLLGGGDGALVRDAERELQGKERDLLNKRKDVIEAEKRIQEAEATQATARQRLVECQKGNTEGGEAGPDESVSKGIRKLRESLAQAQADALAAKEAAVAAATRRDGAQRALADQQKRVGMARQAVKLEEERKHPAAQDEVDVKAKGESLRLAESQLAEASRQLASKQEALIATQAAQKKSAARWAKQASESLASAAYGRKQVAAELAELKAAVPAALKRREAAAARYEAVKVELQDTWTKANSGDRQASKNLKKLRKGAVKAAGDAAEARVSSADLEKRIQALEELDAELRRIDAAAGGRVTARPGSGESEQSLAQKALVAAERDVEVAQTTLRSREETVAAARTELATAKAGVAPGMSSGFQAAKMALADAEKALKALEKQAAQAREQAEDGTEAVAAAEERERRLEAKLKKEEEKGRPVSKAAKALAEAQHEVEEAQLAVQTARTAAAAAKSAAVLAEKDVTQARAAVAEARVEQERMARQEADAERRAAAIKEQEKRVAEAKAEAFALQEEVADAMAARDKAQKVLDKLLAKQQEERAETKAEFTSTLDEARSEAAEAAAARQAAEAELAAARRAVADSQKAAAEAARSLEAGAGAVQQAEEAEKAAKQASEATSSLADELKAAQTQLSKFAKGVKRARDNDEDAKERVSELQAKPVAAEEDAKRQKLGKAFLEAGTDAQEAKQALAIAEARYAAAERQVQERQAALDAAKRQAQGVEAALDSLNDKTPSLRALTAAAAKAQRQLARSQKALVQAEEAVAEAKAEEAATRQQVAELAKGAGGGVAAGPSPKLRQAIEQAQADVAEREGALTASKAQLESAKQIAASEIARPAVELVPSPAVVEQPTVPSKLSTRPDVASSGPEKQTPPGKTFVVKEVVFTGDLEFWESLESSEAAYTSLKDQFVAEIVGSQLSLRSLNDACKTFTEAELHKKRNFWLAYLAPKSRRIEDYRSDGKLTIEVRTGTFGEVTFYNSSGTLKDKDEEEVKEPFSGTYFSEKQIRKRLTMEPGTPFDYGRFHSDTFTINSMPDLTLDGRLKVVQQEDGARRVDTDYYVNEKIPLHATVLVDNTGTEATGEWRSAITTQYLNLTRHYDVLSLDASVALDGSVYSGAGSYFLPFKFLGRDMSVTGFGGYSELSLDEILTGIDIQSKGWFGGVQYQSELLTLGRYRLGVNLESAVRYTDHQILARGEAYPTEVTIAPTSVGLAYSELESDAIGGRNFVSYSFSVNRDGWLASDGDVEFNAARTGAQADYTIHRFQAARLQRLFGKEGKWILYMKGTGQVADGPLVPSEQLALGGMASIRGYREREVLGDDGYTATIELRTPLLDRRDIGIKSDSKPMEIVQFVLFCDYGYLERQEPQPGEFADTDLLGAGLGLRLGLGRYFQVRLDYGWAINDLDEATGETTDDGRLHLSVQAQF